MQTSKRNTFINNIYRKLVGAGFSFSFFVIYLLIIGSFNLFELSEILTSPWLWIPFYVYGLLSSFMIDWLGRIWSWASRFAFLLHVFAGFIVFLFIFDFRLALIIAGPVGALAALLFYIGIKFVTKNKWISYVFALILPLIFLVVSMTDFTKKENWQAIETETSYEAEFSYFNGEHKIPIQLAKGEELSFHVEFFTDDGWGNHLEDKNGKYQLMIEQGDRLVFTADKESEYYIVVKGHRANGRFIVDWEIIH